jgi:hypothetical protein
MHGCYFTNIDVNGRRLLNEANTYHNTVLAGLPHQLTSDACQGTSNYFDPCPSYAVAAGKNRP